MDLELFGRVLWRRRVLVGAGVLAAFVLAFFATVRISPSGIEYRSKEQWSSRARVFVTQQGFPWGKVTGSSLDPGRLSALAVLYANLADTDAVHYVAFGGQPKGGRVYTTPVLALGNSGDALPLISITASSSSRSRATALARRETVGLVEYVNRLQQQNEIPVKNRVVLQVVERPTTPILVTGRSKTLPIVVFLTVLVGVCALAFTLENRSLEAPSVPDEPGVGGHGLKHPGLRPSQSTHVQMTAATPKKRS